MKTLEEAASSLSDHRGVRRDVTLRAVRQWAGERRIGRRRFTRAYEAAFLVAVSRLIQSIFREGHAPHARLWQRDAGHWFLDLGREPMLRAPVSGPLPFRRLELTGCPWKIVAGGWRLLRSPGAFLQALRPCLETSELAQHFDRLIADFDNSFANLVMNRLIGERLDAGARAIEPVYEGHHLSVPGIADRPDAPAGARVLESLPKAHPSVIGRRPALSLRIHGIRGLSHVLSCLGRHSPASKLRRRDPAAPLAT
jgi:hypothetical protein